LKLRRISFSSIRQRKAKSALLVAGLVVGVTAVVALVSLSLAMQRDLSRKLQDYGTSIIVSGKSDSLALSYGGLSVASAAFDVRPLSAEDVARVRTIPDADLLGVVSPVLLAPVTTESQEVLVVGVNFPEQFRLKRWWGQTVGEVNQLVPFRGRKPAHPDEIVLGNLVAAKLQKPVGAPVVIAGRSFKVAAILSEQGSQEDSLVFADLARLQEATARPGAISLIEVGLKSQSVPVEKIDQVERYSSDTEAQPELSRLGSGQWLRVTRRARKAIRAMAAELIELYAARQALRGHAFPADGPLQRALEESFLYDETPDQLVAIEEVKRDMERQRPMDRLVCGDVGYGKTEVALRAAFKAVEAGRQVAVLCPTTLLARQHGETFAERLRDFPVRVETLSRFRSPREQKRVVEAAREGRVDILIGTHRLLSRDVRLPALGLLVVDEEHRFGVRHKERLKELRRLVDVITLSATPIPRTLYLALMGARDMSLINTPPRDRLPIHTELCAYSETVLQEAILRELHRGGQVFFVHNRIETIEAVASRVRDLLPGVRLAVAHGQMPEDRLEHVMADFLAHGFDVLVTTAIIESGLDMPRVNTIIIDRADRFGLAQLYQLRGRVGRSSQRAFAYLMTPPGETLTADARRRLAALEEFQALGSGYHIAMRDLEIRGAGNLLGEEQHGHMEAIGFDLYCRLLEETVLELKGGGGAAALEVRVDLRLPAYLPDDWIGDAEQKMDLYRRLARLREGRDFARLQEELRDRYGPLPEEVANLLGIQRVRVLAAAVGVEEVRADRQGVSLFFAGGREPSPAIIRGLMGTGQRGLQFKAADQFVIRIPAQRDQGLAAAHAILDLLERLGRETAGGTPVRGAGKATVKEPR